MLLNAAAHRPCRDLRTPQHRVLFTACGLRPEDVQRVSLANEPCAGSAVLQIRSAARSPRLTTRTTSSSRGGSARCSRISRSEEHTSELQSRENLVCRLLL